MENKLTRENVIKAMGFEAASGPAARSFGALRAYNLIERTENRLNLTDVGEALATDPNDMDALQKASLSPMVFRGIWRRARLASEDEMTELLLARRFTEDGARQTAKIYKINAALAQLDQLEVEPVLPERSAPNRPGRMIEEKLRQNLLSNSRGQKDAFRMPVSTGVAVIPKGISEDEFRLIIETMQMWKAQIVVS